MSARQWTEAGTKLLLTQVDQLTDAQFAEPTVLAGWTRAHLVAHVHFNAQALRRLLTWAATGVEHRMYASPEQRNAEIESGAQLPASELRALALESAEALAHDMDALTDEAWQRPVITAQGRTVPASEVPWLRAREVCIHAVDLDTGLTFTDLPQDFLTALATDAVRKHAAAGQVADLASWLTGRVPTAPDLGRWL
ncbi:maleylpyruvate isomerase [Kibdelosporangium banguiense]|uniref:Maleylpyruvate isomerase n=1 Tax=Kibdelosporangium banguiense TaxID=1365924 RepID=A0ABS4TRF8_9PSEU|nr:maleylpyruvate isomerase family mycothiol-dependent enzyme [Kibdelosporangium banguiense]MBP2327000.1 maleylpyruvate isomerase [Kibdelosporangium banguiense]